MKFANTMDYQYVIDAYGTPSFTLTVSICLPLYILSIACFFLMTNLSMVEKTGLNINDLEDIVTFVSNAQGIEMDELEPFLDSIESCGKFRSCGIQCDLLK